MTLIYLGLPRASIMVERGRHCISVVSAFVPSFTIPNIVELELKEEMCISTWAHIMYMYVYIKIHGEGGGGGCVRIYIKKMSDHPFQKLHVLPNL